MKLLPGALHEAPLRVMATRDGHFYLGNQGVASEKLPGRIGGGIGGGSEKGAYILADARGKYGDVKMVLDQIRPAEDVSFLTRVGGPR